MKKKLLVILMSLYAVVGIVACGEGSDNEEAANSKTESTINNSESIDEETELESSSKEKTLSDIESYMQSSGILSGERTQMAADIVGAIDGFKYTDSGVEVYEYDINSEEYTALSNGEEIELKGMEGFTIGAIAINGKYVLMGEPSQEAIDVFSSFK